MALALAMLDGRNRWVGRVATAGLAVNLVVTIALAETVLRQGPVEMMAGGWPQGVGITFRADALGVVFASLANAVLFAALLYELLGGIRARAFPALVLFMDLGLTGLFLTGDAFNFYVFFEISMISAFVLTGYGGQPRRMRATLVFVVINLLGSVLFLAAVGALYRVTGTLDLRLIAADLSTVHPNALGLIGALLLAAFSLKIGLFPSHAWLPPVYRDSRPAVAAILSGALANIGNYGLLRFGGDVMPDLVRQGTVVLVALGGASILYGAILAISRFPTGEVLAYSAVGQAGYIFIALAVGGPVGYGAAVLYAVVNSLNKTVLFLARGLRGWLVGAAFAVAAFSVAGVPPAAGFIGKAAVFRAGVDSLGWVLVALVFLGSVLSFVYMFQIYQRDYWTTAGTSERRVSPIAVRLFVLLLAGGLLLLGLWPEPLLAVSQQAASVLDGGSP
jgi:multicomponent Na+:H+ antiporter subunit D